ncbi:MAG: hypothetical protein ACLQU2_14150 [Candidatus Binataceae bacterium]
MCATEQPRPHGDADGARDKKKTFYERFKHDIKNPRFAVEVVALVFLIIYTLFTGYQSCQMRKSTKAATESADASVASVRAWIGITSIEGPDVGSIQTQPLTRKIENTGRAPGLNLNFIEEYIPWPKNGQVRMPQFSNCPATGQRFFYPAIEATGINQSVSVSPPLPFPLKDKELADLKSRKTALVIHGCVTYDNIGSMPQGTTEYCWILYVIQNSFMPCAPANRMQ